MGSWQIPESLSGARRVAEGTKTLGDLLEYRGYRALESFCEDQGIPVPADEPLHPIDPPIDSHQPRGNRTRR